MYMCEESLHTGATHNIKFNTDIKILCKIPVDLHNVMGVCNSINGRRTPHFNKDNSLFLIDGHSYDN